MKRFILKYQVEGTKPLYLYEDEESIVLTERADKAIRMELSDCITFIAGLSEHRERWHIMKLDTSDTARVTPFSKYTLHVDLS